MENTTTNNNNTVCMYSMYVCMYEYNIVLSFPLSYALYVNFHSDTVSHHTQYIL